MQQHFVEIHEVIFQNILCKIDAEVAEQKPAGVDPRGGLLAKADQLYEEHKSQELYDLLISERVSLSISGASFL